MNFSCFNHIASCGGEDGHCKFCHDLALEMLQASEGWNNKVSWRKILICRHNS